MREQSNGYPPDLQLALDHLLESGGKRVRPTITLLAGEMVDAPKDKVITLAAAVELLHTATLVHDDVIDGSLLRRGKPNLECPLVTWSYHPHRRLHFCTAPPNWPLKLNPYRADEACLPRRFPAIVNGEITQLFVSKGLISREDYYQRIYAKTASLFELSCIAPVYLVDEDAGNHRNDENVWLRGWDGFPDRRRCA